MSGDIIIKKVKKVAGGHHGGAWKVAYADFVTAMMAFFLLLWLLNATEAENLAGLADYFAPTVGVKDEMGIGFRGGKSALSDGIGADKNTNKGIVFGGVPTGPITKVTEVIEERTDQQKQEQIQVLINETDTNKKGTEDQGEDKAVSDNPQLATQAAEQPDKGSEEMQKTEQALATAIDEMVKNKRVDEGTVEIKRTPEGLMIEIKDIVGNSMFEKDSAVMKQKLKDALAELSKILKNIPNSYAIIGHTSSAAIISKKQGYTKWEISSDRAHATRIFLEKNGIPPEQFSRIEGRADNVPYDATKPESPINSRVNIIILSKSDIPEHKKATPNSILLDTKAEKAKKFIEDTEEAEKPAEEQNKKPEAPVKENEQFKQLLQESTQKPTTAAPVNIKPAEVINLDIDSTKKEEVKPVDTRINNEAQKIFEDATKPKVVPANLPVNTRPAAVIDLTVDKKVEEEKPLDDGSTNQQFQNIIKDIEKLKQQRPPQIPGQPAQ